MAISDSPGTRRETPGISPGPARKCEHESVWMVDVATRRVFKQPCQACAQQQDGDVEARRIRRRPA